MNHLFFPQPPSKPGECILCNYINVTNSIQIICISNIPCWYFERVVFPGQRLLFTAVLEAQLKIYTGDTASAVIADNIPCSRLQVGEGGDTSLEPINC